MLTGKIKILKLFFRYKYLLTAQRSIAARQIRVIGANEAICPV
jgi:hypothetical protein